jgi:hypothetical protein
MNLTVKLADTKVTIAFLSQAEKAIPLCNQYFQDFLSPDQEGDSKVEVSILQKPNSMFPLGRKAGYRVFEQLLPTHDVVSWLKKSPGYTENVPISEKTICSYCLGGLLLFDPGTAKGSIYILNQGPRCLQPLYRLLWMYFAQALGERAGCFVHAAALVRHGEGHLFLGGSGSGKTTLAKHCTGCYVLSDDAPIITRKNGECLIYPSPYHQMGPEEVLDKDVIQMRAKLKGIYFLIKDDQFFLEDVSRAEALLMIIKRYIHFFPYLSKQAKEALFDLLFEVCYKIKSYKLHFRQDQDVWSMSKD